ncbi:hypothetical protein G6L46_30035 [Agrobacterium rhizogenes]|uniref:hypothetical protein n=1 Tax=Rhizobium rhizogenes TaxID=359 RepID=UPI00157418BF|nr:hypothetical protein [Rhizobium rhizogenes]NTF91411.1 hypothetical protein [Rhizobium rhizogenes]
MRYQAIPIFWHMKKPRPKFVVEYKTNRRQAKARPTSTWGNLGLQAVGRAKSSLPQVRSVLEKVVAADPDVAAIFAQVEIKGLPAPPNTSSLNEGHIEPVVIEGKVFAAPFVQEERTLAPPQAPRSRAKPRTKRRSPDTTERPAVQGYRRGPSVLPGFEEELAAIEAENRRLKRLLIVKLREENDRLKFALRRFGGA